MNRNKFEIPAGCVDNGYFLIKVTKKCITFYLWARTVEELEDMADKRTTIVPSFKDMLDPKRTTYIAYEGKHIPVTI